MLDLKKCEERFQKTANCLVLLKAWQRWRGDDDVTRVSNIRMEELAGFMQGMAIFDILPHENIIYRMAGTLHERTFGMALKGRSILDLVPPDGRRELVRVADIVCSTPCGYTDIRETVRENGLKEELVSVAFPLKPASDDDPPRVISAIDSLPDKLGHSNPTENVLSNAIQYELIDIGFGTPESE